MNIRELSALTGTPERQIRYMIAEGFVPPPRGGRAHADYGDDHVEAIDRYARLRQQGFPPQAIRALLEGGTTAPFPVAPGVALHVDPNLLGTTMNTAMLADRIRHVLEELFKEPTDDERPPSNRNRPR